MVIRAALARRAGHRLERFQRVPNGGLVPLDPVETQHAALGGGASTMAS
jgi:hypothetical protein